MHTETTAREREDTEPDAQTIGERVRRRGEAIADREVDYALRKLEARGDLTDRQRRAVRAMADGIVDSLVAEPARTAARASDEETRQTVVDLFDPDRE